MVAEDHSDSKGSAKAIYNVIRKQLLETEPGNLLPLVYLVDSILKNVKGKYIEIIEADAESWMPLVYRQLQDPQKEKLQKVWKTWNDARIFASEALKSMGRCFEDRATTAKMPMGMKPIVSGIRRAVRVLAWCVLLSGTFD